MTAYKVTRGPLSALSEPDHPDHCGRPGLALLSDLSIASRRPNAAFPVFSRLLKGRAVAADAHNHGLLDDDLAAHRLAVNGTMVLERAGRVERTSKCAGALRRRNDAAAIVEHNRV